MGVALRGNNRTMKVIAKDEATRILDVKKKRSGE